MDIKFNILIVEDDSDFAKETKENLIDQMNHLDLAPNIITKSNYPQEKIKDIGAKFDLLLVDYNLADDDVGTTLISKVRKLSMLPDIIFYSSQSSIQDIIAKEEAENRESLITLLQKGIYFSKSDNLDKIAMDVIKKITNREEKINGFKGMVLSFVSEYEELVNSIIYDALSKIKDTSSIDSYISTDILGDIMSNGVDKKNKFDAEENPVKSLEVLNYSNRHIDHSKRVRTMNRILGNIGIQSFDFQTYKSEILDLRNSVSHISSVDDLENTHYTFTVNGELIALTPEYCSKIRRLLSKYKKELIMLSEKVKRIESD